MAKDDYFVVVYQILAYLYQRLKKGEPVDKALLEHDSPLFDINKKYWAYIIYNMASGGLIEGIRFVDIDGLDFPLATCLDNCQITPMGIDYLFENSFIEKAKTFLKEVKEIVPFV